MQKLTDAKMLTNKAETYLTEGNYDYAVRCYEKIIVILTEVLKEATSKETLMQIKAKIDKFNALKAQAESKKK